MRAAQGLYDPRNEHDACGVGFIAQIENRASHGIVVDGLKILSNLSHRGAEGADPLAGDGAGILIQLPDRLFRDESSVWVSHCRPRATMRSAWSSCRAARKPVVWLKRRLKPTSPPKVRSAGLARRAGQFGSLGESIKPIEPAIRQVFIRRGDNCPDVEAFERKLFVIRKQSHKDVRALKLPDAGGFYIVSLSTRTIIYKGMVIADRFAPYYADLQDDRVESALALVHARFSTNTFPSWELAHPFRYLAHNGEINTLRGNINWMMARRHSMTLQTAGRGSGKTVAADRRRQFRSATLDNCLELSSAGGYALPHALMMMIPEAWSGNDLMNPERRAFYEYHAALMEPWTAPRRWPSRTASDRRTLDRNGCGRRAFRHQRRYRGDGLGGRRAGYSGGEDRPQMAA